MIITNLIIALVVSGAVIGVRYLLWKDENVPENISKFRWLIAFGVVILAIMIEVGANLASPKAQLVNFAILFTVAQILKNKKSDIKFVCSNCNHKANNNDKYCPSCGASLSEIVSEEEKQNISTFEDDINNIHYKCGNCHSPINKKDKFCFNCGSALRTDKFGKG
jgi:RNA polymerase subunit RPABC4/transcription elongation factor Spt4